MKNLFLILAFLIYGISQPAFASEKLLQQLDLLVKNTDVNGVENLISDVVSNKNKPLYARNKDLRSIFTTFMTTHPDYISLMAKWSNDKPDSIYAKTAKGWHLYHVAWLIRGETISREIYHKAAEQMRDFFQTSATLAYDVFSTSANFAPASDLVLVSSQHAHIPVRKQTLANNALIANRDTHTLGLVLRLYSPKWGGGLRKQKALCRKYEDILIEQDGYTADMCFAEQIISDSMLSNPRGLTEEMIARAYEIMEAAPKDKMLKARWVDAVYIRPDIDGALELVAELLPDKRNTYPILAQRVEVELSKEGFSEAYLKTKKAEMMQRITKDPYNPDLLEKVISYTYAEYQKTRSPQTLALYEKYIEDAMIYGKYRPKIWISKANPYSEKLFSGEFEETSIRNIISIWDQAIKYSNYSPKYLSDFYGIMSLPKNVIDMQAQFEAVGIDPPNGTMTIDTKAIGAVIECPMIRAARLYELICNANMNSKQCNGHSHPLNWSKVVMKEAKEKNICPARMIEPEENLLIGTDEWLKQL